MKILKNKIFRILLWVTTISSFGDSLYALASDVISVSDVRIYCRCGGDVDDQSIGQDSMSVCVGSDYRSV